MKHLTIMMLVAVLAGLAKGQGVSRFTLPGNLADTARFIQPNHWLVSAWDAYAKECWADSALADRCGELCRWDSECTDSVHVSHYYGPPRLTLEYIDVRTLVPRFFYTHSRPTFEGFIEWLRKQ